MELNLTSANRIQWRATFALNDSESKALPVVDIQPDQLTVCSFALECLELMAEPPTKTAIVEERTCVVAEAVPPQGSECYVPVASYWHLVIVLVAQGAIIYRGILRALQAHAVARIVSLSISAPCCSNGSCSDWF